MQASPGRDQAVGDSPLSITSVPAEEIVPWTVFCRGPIWYTYVGKRSQVFSSPLHADPDALPCGRASLHPDIQLEGLFLKKERLVLQ
jgi:hypothetical protein